MPVRRSHEDPLEPRLKLGGIPQAVDSLVTFEEGLLGKILSIVAAPKRSGETRQGTKQLFVSLIELPRGDLQGLGLHR